VQEGETVKTKPNEVSPWRVPTGDDPDGDIRGRWPWVERAVWTERMLAALERGPKHGVWHSLIDKVYAPRTLWAAWEKVAANNGAAGVDKVSVAVFARTAVAELATLSRQLGERSYQPKPVKRTWIPKSGSAEQRPLGIPAVRDRMVQTAPRRVLEPIFEREFAPESFGFRPGRGCQDAIDRVEQLLADGYTHVVDADLKSYFDPIPHEPLLAWVKTKVVDGRILDLVAAYLRQGVREEGKGWSPTELGTPQGAVISPLLANLSLNALDWKLRLDGWELVRYADDFVVLCRTREHAEAVLRYRAAMDRVGGVAVTPAKDAVGGDGAAGRLRLPRRSLRARRPTLAAGEELARRPAEVAWADPAQLRGGAQGADRE
jgi:RNA-directed DNA polymerase